MDGCCSSDNVTEHYPNSHGCPVNGRRYSSVKRKTVLHHIEAPWAAELTEQGYYFCTDPDCEVVYYGQDDSVFRQSQVRTSVWQKSGNTQSTICYCFGISQQLAAENRTMKEFVIKQTQSSLCSCETSNPSGRCCLKDFSI